MANFKELLAAKRAQEAKEAQAKITNEPLPASEQSIEQEVAAQEITNDQATAKLEVIKPVTVIASKPLSFQEKMALKKADAGAALVKPVEIKPAIVQTQAITPAAVAGKGNEDSDAATEQAYANIKNKIELLESLEDTVLEGAMKDLKKALMENPNAVSLMLDEDIGKMVLALRRITNEAQVEVAKDKAKSKKEKKAAPLSPEMLDQVFDEL